MEDQLFLKVVVIVLVADFLLLVSGSGDDLDGIKELPVGAFMVIRGIQVLQDFISSRPAGKSEELPDQHLCIAGADELRCRNSVNDHFQLRSFKGLLIAVDGCFPGIGRSHDMEPHFFKRLEIGPDRFGRAGDAVFLVDRLQVFQCEVMCCVCVIHEGF